MASDPLKKLLGLPDEPVDVNPDISLGVLANPHASQAPDLTGYFSQLETSRSPAHVAGIDARASDEEKRQQQETDASTELTDPGLSALHERDQRDKLAVAGEPNRVAGVSNQQIEQMRADAQRQVAQTAANAKTHASDAAATAAANKLPVQTQQKAIQAGEVADQLEGIDREVDDPDLQPYIGAIAGRLTDLTSGKLLPNEVAQSLSSDPAVQFKLAKFSSDLSTSAAAVSAAHGRGGAANPALMQEYMHSLTRSTTPAMLHGSIASAKDWMLKYAHPQPVGDPLKQMLGIPGHVSTDPNYQPQ